VTFKPNKRWGDYGRVAKLYERAFHQQEGCCQEMFSENQDYELHPYDRKKVAELPYNFGDTRNYYGLKVGEGELSDNIGNSNYAALYKKPLREYSKERVSKHHFPVKKLQNRLPINVYNKNNWSKRPRGDRSKAKKNRKKGLRGKSRSISITNFDPNTPSRKKKIVRDKSPSDCHKMFVSLREVIKEDRSRPKTTRDKSRNKSRKRNKTPRGMIKKILL